MALAVSVLPGCCGIRVISGFPYDQTKTFEEEFKKTFEAVKQYIVLCSFIEKQKHVEDTFRKFGFRQVSSTLVNPNSQNNLWVFLYDKKELKDVKKSVFKKKVVHE